MFAHRGARAHAPENTIEAFELAVRLGATGIESDVWLTTDGVAVLDHDGEFRVGRFRKRRVDETAHAELPAHIPTLSDLLDLCHDDVDVSLDLKGPDTGAAVVEIVAARPDARRRRVWLCHHDPDELERLRPLDPDVKLVDTARLDRIAEGPERRAARLAALGADGINMRNLDWNGGLVALFHRFGLTAFAWDLQFDHHLRPALRMGIDGVYSDHVDRMVDAFRAEIGATP
jgi:glycerophosphoryl diester phosphodiesterase